MAFLTTSDIAAKLPTGFDEGAVDRLLLSAEADLKRIGLVFTDEAASAFTVQVDHIPRCVFNITPTRLITSIAVKRNGSSTSTTLTSGTNYVAHSHTNVADYTVQIELLDRELRFNDVLEITGKRGIYINFDSDSYEDKLLTAGIVDWVESQLNVKSGQRLTKQGIVSAGTGESRVSYGSNSGMNSSITVSSIIQDIEFQSVKDYFFGV